MLVIDRMRRRMQHNDDGAVLVTVVIVMLVGFVVAVLVASSALFTIQANSSNTQNTQAFIAAESGRDAAYDSIKGAILDGSLTCDSGLLSGGSSDANGPQYSYAIRTTALATPEISWEALGHAGDVCPDENTTYIVIQSTGTDGAASVTIDSVYPWTKVPDTQPAGTVAYFEGQFTATKTTYEGDLVIRSGGDYSCNNGAGHKIDGDLWVLQANMNVTGDCWVTGSIYVFGSVNIGNKDFRVDGDIFTQTGSVNITAKDATVGGDIYSGANVSLTKNGVIGGKIRAVGTISPTNPTNWTHPGGAPLITATDVLPSQPAPVFTPTLAAVYDATAWLELTPTTDWGSDAEKFTDRCAASGATGFGSVLSAPGDRAVFDLSGCGSSLTLSFGNVTLERDAVFLIPSSTALTVNLNTTISPGAGNPQLLIVQLDSNRNDNRPTACSGGPIKKLAGGGSIQVRTLIYSPCGINNTTTVSLTGQLYLGSVGIHLNNESNFDCEPMSWQPAFGKLSCGVKGEGGVFDPNRMSVAIESLNYQAEH